MQKQKEFLGTEPIVKLLFRLSIPTVLAQLINMLYNIIDRIYIGHIPESGSLALTGVGVCMPMILIVSSFAALVGSGGAPYASIYMGKQDYDSAERTMGNCFSLQLIISVVLTVLLLLFGKQLLFLFGASPNTISYAHAYLQIYALGTLFVQMTLGMNAFITAQGFTMTSMVAVLIGALCNIILDPIFIFVFSMGVRGAALATILSQAIACIWILRFLYGKKTRLRLKRKNMRLQTAVIVPCITLGTATFIMQITESIITICFNASLLRYGGDLAVGAMTILSSIMQFAMLPLMGFAQGAQPIISYNFGASNLSRVRKTFWLLVLCCLIYSGSLWTSVMCVPQLFIKIFTPDPTLTVFSIPMLRIYMAGILLFGIQVACQITFTSLGKAGCSIIVAVFRKCVLLIPLIYIVPHLISDPVTGVYLAEPIADVLAVIFTAVLFYFQFKKVFSKSRKKAL